MNVVCIDGSLQNLGLAVVAINHASEIDGVVKLYLNKTEPTKDKKMRKSYDDLNRFRSHWLFLQDVIKEHDCKLSIGEVPSGSQDSRASFAFGGVTAMYACLPIPFIPVTAQEVKLAATGFKFSEKEDMIEWGYNKYPDLNWLTSKRSNKMNIVTPTGLYLKNENEHLADAIGVGFAGLKYI